jgi:hypothetical protein
MKNDTDKFELCILKVKISNVIFFGGKKAALRGDRPWTDSAATTQTRHNDAADDDAICCAVCLGVLFASFNTLLLLLVV